MSDFIGDFLTVVRNASRAKHEKVTVSASNLTAKLTEVLKQNGFIENYKLIDEDGKRFLRIHLRYAEGKEPVIKSIIQVSKPGRRVYMGYRDIPRVLGGLGIGIVSTSKGLMSDKKARQDKLGGELICTVY